MNLRLVLISMLLSAFSIPVVAAEGGSSVFSQLNLDYPGLEGVKNRHAKGDDAAAADSLLAYFRSRKNAGTPELPSLQGITITAQQQKIADEALEHRFFVHGDAGIGSHALALWNLWLFRVDFSDGAFHRITSLPVLTVL